jgi:hypothetical protein
VWRQQHGVGETDVAGSGNGDFHLDIITKLVKCSSTT